MIAANAFLNEWASAWSAAMIRACWLGGLVMLLVWGITKLMPRIPAFARCWLWRAAYLKLFLALVWIPPIKVPLLPPAPDTVISRLEDVSMSSVNPQPIPGDGHAEASLPADRHLRDEVNRITLFPAAYLFAAWSCGVGICLVFVGRNWLALQRLQATCDPITDSELTALATEMFQRFGATRYTKLLKTKAVVSPQLIGAFRPSIILPESLIAPHSLVQTRMVVAHELSHWKRRDLLWNWLPTIGSVLFFFHPAVWLAQREWRLTQEIACDELAVRIAKIRTDEFGRFLLDVVRTCHSSWHHTYFSVGVSQSFKDLSRRVIAMKMYEPRSKFRNAGTAFLVLFGAAVGLVPWTLTAQQNRPSITGVFQAGSAVQSTAAESGTESKDAGQPAVSAGLNGRIVVGASVRRLSEKDDGSNGTRNMVISIDPNTGDWKTLATGGHSVRVSRDGSTVAFATAGSRNQDFIPYDNSAIWLCESRNGDNSRRIASVSGIPIWSPDGRELVVSDGKVNEEDKKETPEKPVWDVVTWKFNSDGSNKTRLSVPDSDSVEDWSPDGHWFVTNSDRHAPFGRGYQLYLMRIDGTMQRRLTKGGLNVHARFSPDGKRIVYLHQEKGDNSIRIIEVADGHETLILSNSGMTHVRNACWSPDGKHLAVLLMDWELDADGGKILRPENSNPRLAIMESDGKNRRELTLQDAKVSWINHPDWK